MLTPTLPTTPLNPSQLAKVLSVQDPDQQGRVKVKLLGAASEGHAEIWARVATPFNGLDRGTLFTPDVGDEVLVTFVSGDARSPVVIGGLWNGSKPPVSKAAGDPTSENQTIIGKAGTKISMFEAPGATERIVLETPHGVKGTFIAAPDGSLKYADSFGNAISFGPGGITLVAAAKVSVAATQVEITAGTVMVDAAHSQFSGLVKCDVLQANSVIAANYSPGVGNVM